MSVCIVPCKGLVSHIACIQIAYLLFPMPGPRSTIIQIMITRLLENAWMNVLLMKTAVLYGLAILFSFEMAAVKIDWCFSGSCAWLMIGLHWFMQMFLFSSQARKVTKLSSTACSTLHNSKNISKMWDLLPYNIESLVKKHYKCQDMGLKTHKSGNH